MQFPHLLLINYVQMGRASVAKICNPITLEPQRVISASFEFVSSQIIKDEVTDTVYITALCL